MRRRCGGAGGVNQGQSSIQDWSPSAIGDIEEVNSPGLIQELTAKHQEIPSPIQETRPPLYDRRRAHSVGACASTSKAHFARSLPPACSASPSAPGSQRIAFAARILVERLLTRLLEDAPDRWVRFDDWRLEYRYDGPASAHDASEGVSEHARATVDAAFRRVTEHQELKPVHLAVRPCDRWPAVSQGLVLAYRIEASDRDGEIGDVDLLVGFAYPSDDEIEWTAGLDVLAAQDGPPPLLPTRDTHRTDCRSPRGICRPHKRLPRM